MDTNQSIHIDMILTLIIRINCRNEVQNELSMVSRSYDQSKAYDAGKYQADRSGD